MSCKFWKNCEVYFTSMTAVNRQKKGAALHGNTSKNSLEKSDGDFIYPYDDSL